MEKLETPLTWILAILILGYFSLNNCCKLEPNDEINNGFSWSTTSDEVILPVKINSDIPFSESEIDSMLEAVLQELSDTIELENNVDIKAVQIITDDSE